MPRRGRVTEQTVAELRTAAERFRPNKRGADHLVGRADFRREWAKYGRQNTLRVTEMWRQARQERNEAREAARHARAEVAKLQELAHDRSTEVIDDPADFPALRQRLNELEDAVARSDLKLAELQQISAQELSCGNERLAELEQTVDVKLKDLHALRSVMAAEERELDQLRAANMKREDLRRRLSAFVSEVDKELRR